MGGKIDLLLSSPILRLTLQSS
jgi:hypothetical protein